ncbi:MAG: hypothetical protein H6543_03045 [Prevotellaceae bacterium]|nr:hypothetical protein [Prevotellaceae bacterium]
MDGWLELQYDLSYMHYRNDYFAGDFKQAAIVNPTYPIYDQQVLRVILLQVELVNRILWKA